jgi:hypothetical protein
MMISFNRLKRDTGLQKSGTIPVNQSFADPLPCIPDVCDVRPNRHEASDLKPEGRLADSMLLVKENNCFQHKGGCGFATGIEI